MHKPAFFFGGLIGMVAVVLGTLLLFSFALQSPVKSSKEIFRIEPNTTLTQIAFTLQRKGIINNARVFIAYSRITGKDRYIKAGSYQLSSVTSLRELLDLLTNGSNINITVVLPEGLTLKETLQRLKEAGLDVNDAPFLSPPFELTREYPFLADLPQTASLEGFLFPDTYKFHLDASADEVAQTLLDNFETKFDSNWYEEIERQRKSVYQIIIMASLLEKELRAMEDKKIASGILWKRFELGMPLQLDATINYVTGKNLPAVTLNDLAIDSPYNTYKYAGLPPGPISNPGRESLEAAISPESSDYWFYLSRQDTGETIFSRTFQEHNRAKAMYLP